MKSIAIASIMIFAAIAGLSGGKNETQKTNIIGMPTTQIEATTTWEPQYETVPVQVYEFEPLHIKADAGSLSDTSEPTPCANCF